MNDATFIDAVNYCPPSQQRKPTVKKATFRDSTYEPDRDAQGEGIEWIKAHANMEITREDSASMNCGVFVDMIEACNYIGDVEHINPSRVYVALSVKGRNICYHEMKVNHSDVFTDIEEQVSRGKRSIDSPSKRAIARQVFTIFNNVESTKFDTDRQTRKIAVDESKKCGVQTSHLNLYWALTGLKYVVENDPMYNMYSDKPLFVDPLILLIKADVLLNERVSMLNAWMAI